MQKPRKVTRILKFCTHSCYLFCGVGSTASGCGCGDYSAPRSPSVEALRPPAAPAQTRLSGRDTLGLAVASTDLPLGGKRYGCGVSERSRAPHSSNGGVSEDAIPKFHLCVGVSVYGRDDGSALLEFHLPLSWRPDLADAHAPLYPRTVRAGATHAHLHPPGPEQGQTAGAAAASPAARTHRQVGALRLFISPPTAVGPCSSPSGDQSGLETR